MGPDMARVGVDADGEDGFTFAKDRVNVVVHDQLLRASSGEDGGKGWDLFPCRVTSDWESDFFSGGILLQIVSLFGVILIFELFLAVKVVQQAFSEIEQANHRQGGSTEGQEGGNDRNDGEETPILEGETVGARDKHGTPCTDEAKGKDDEARHGYFLFPTRSKPAQEQPGNQRNWDRNEHLLEKRGAGGPVCEVAVVEDVHPQTRDRHNEEERDLDKDGQQQDEFVDTVDNQGRSDTLKRLPSKDTNELPGEETKDDQSDGVNRQEGDLINVARTPSTREEVDSIASAVAGQTVEFRTEAGSVPDLEACPCRSQTVGEESGDDMRDGLVQNGDDGHAKGPDLEGEQCNILGSGLQEDLKGPDDGLDALLAGNNRTSREASHFDADKLSLFGDFFDIPISLLPSLALGRSRTGLGTWSRRGFGRQDVECSRSILRRGGTEDGRGSDQGSGRRCRAGTIRALGSLSSGSGSRCGAIVVVAVIVVVGRSGCGSSFGGLLILDIGQNRGRGENVGGTRSSGNGRSRDGGDGNDGTQILGRNGVVVIVGAV